MGRLGQFLIPKGGENEAPGATQRLHLLTKLGSGLAGDIWCKVVKWFKKSVGKTACWDRPFLSPGHGFPMNIRNFLMMGMSFGTEIFGGILRSQVFRERTSFRSARCCSDLWRSQQKIMKIDRLSFNKNSNGQRRLEAGLPNSTLPNLK